MDVLAEVFAALAVMAVFAGLSAARAARSRRMPDELARLSGSAARRAAEEREIEEAARERRAGRLPFPFGWLERRARQSGVRADPRTIFALAAGAAVGLFLTGWSVTGIWWLGALAAAGGLAAPAAWINHLAGRRAQQVVAQLEELCRQLGQAMRAGMTLQLALEDVAREMPAPLGDDIRQVVRSFRVAGMPLREAIGELDRAAPLPEMALLTSAMRIHIETGANLPDILDGLIRTLHERREMRSVARAATAQGRLEMNILLGMPFFLLLVFRLIAPGYVRPLFGTPAGLLVFFAGSAWELAGWWFMRALMRVDPAA